MTLFVSLIFFALFATMTFAFQTASLLKTVPGRHSLGGLRMSWKAKETNEHFLIAPSILSADFARLGEEVISLNDLLGHSADFHPPLSSLSLRWSTF
jgi:hypothetical protein